jgi:hypothetical protein
MQLPLFWDAVPRAPAPAPPARQYVHAVSAASDGALAGCSPVAPEAFATLSESMPTGSKPLPSHGTSPAASIGPSPSSLQAPLKLGRSWVRGEVPSHCRDARAVAPAPPAEAQRGGPHAPEDLSLRSDPTGARKPQPAQCPTAARPASGAGGLPPPQPSRELRLPLTAAPPVGGSPSLPGTYALSVGGSVADSRGSSLLLGGGGSSVASMSVVWLRDLDTPCMSRTTSTVASPARAPPLAPRARLPHEREAQGEAPPAQLLDSGASSAMLSCVTASPSATQAGLAGSRGRGSTLALMTLWEPRGVLGADAADRPVTTTQLARSSSALAAAPPASGGGSWQQLRAPSVTRLLSVAAAQAQARRSSQAMGGPDEPRGEGLADTGGSGGGSQPLTAYDDDTWASPFIARSGGGGLPTSLMTTLGGAAGSRGAEAAPSGGSASGMLAGVAPPGRAGSSSQLRFSSLLLSGASFIGQSGLCLPDTVPEERSAAHEHVAVTVTAGAADGAPVALAAGAAAVRQDVAAAAVVLGARPIDASHNSGQRRMPAAASPVRAADQPGAASAAEPAHPLESAGLCGQADAPQAVLGKGALGRVTTTPATTQPETSAEEAAAALPLPRAGARQGSAPGVAVPTPQSAEAARGRSWLCSCFRA